MTSVPDALARRVRLRARHRCEYCLLSQEGQEATFHIDHVHPRRLGGETSLENLALACVSCSLRKGAAIDAIDPDSDRPAPLFDPRIDTWADHFQLLEDASIAGLTPTGRATITRLAMNRTTAIGIRSEEIARGRFP
jgi:hypothetical protein